MLNSLQRFGALVGGCVLSSSAVACPFCQSETADKIRAGIFNEDFGYHALALVAPFPVLIGILLLIYFDPPDSVLKLLSSKSVTSSQSRVPLRGGQVKP